MATNPNHTIGAIVNEDEGTVTVTLNGVGVAQLSAEYFNNGEFRGLLSQRVKYSVVDNTDPHFPFTSETISAGGVSLSSEHIVHEVSLPVLQSLSLASGFPIR